LAQHPRVVALGETGLDYHRLPSSRHRPKDSLRITAFGNEDPVEIEDAIEDGAYKSRQADFFQQQIDLAAELGLNVVIHQRDAWDDTLDILRPYSGKVRGVFHCFGGTLDQAREVIALGHLISFTGIVTFKNAAELRELAAAVPETSFMVETDCPYLAPAPYRGKRCEPAHTRITAEAIARERKTRLEELAQVTTATADAFFRFHR
jgi:TatD DNase family protein